MKLTGRTFHGGILRESVRPSLPWDDREWYENTEIAQEMRERYLVSAKKTALAITIANRERALLQDIDYEHGYSYM